MERGLEKSLFDDLITYLLPNRIYLYVNSIFRSGVLLYEKFTFFLPVCRIIFTSVMGTLLHFAYDLSNQSAFFALFSAINESVWEHMKLLFFPMLVFAWIESRSFAGEYESFWCVKLIGIVSGLVMIPTLFYTYTGVFGLTKDFINIAIFFLVVAFTYILETRLLKQGKVPCRFPKAAVALLLVIAVAFVVFTFNPPGIPLFKEPS